jgi:hypothetical protein
VFGEIQGCVNDGMRVGFVDFRKLEFGYEIGMKDDVGNVNNGIEYACRNYLIHRDVRGVIAFVIRSIHSD